MMDCTILVDLMEYLGRICIELQVIRSFVLRYDEDWKLETFCMIVMRHELG